MENDQTIAEDFASGDDSRAEAAARKFAQQGASVLPALRELLESKNVDTRWWATWTLALLSHPDVGSLLREKLKDKDNSVRQCAALALREQPDVAAIPGLVGLLEEQDPILARLGAAALIAIGKEAVPTLLEVAQNGSKQARLEAIRSLANIGDERAIPTLIAACQEGTAMMEFWANEGLEKLGVGMVLFNPGESPGE